MQLPCVNLRKNPAKYNFPNYKKVVAYLILFHFKPKKREKNGKI